MGNIDLASEKASCLSSHFSPPAGLKGLWCYPTFMLWPLSSEAKPLS